MRHLIIIFFIFLTGLLPAQNLPGFKPSGSFEEQQMVIEDSPPGTRILINAPLSGFGTGDRVLLVLHALPNGNTIEQTFGKRLREGDDWHYDIRHIGAQSGTKYEQKGYRYFGSRAYSDLIADTVIKPIRTFNIPARDPLAETGTAFMSRIRDLPREEREEEIFRAAASGNIPGFLRETIALRGVFNDLNGKAHTLEYEVLPDYLAIGSDDDFCRIPMNPRTAQRLADLFGASMLTDRLSDHIWSQAAVRLEPFFYKPAGNANELVAKFEEHNAQIEKQLAEAGGRHGQLVAGIKKDVIISYRIAERPDRVVIYGWHKPDGTPIQPVYSGHVYWYVDYSHGIRFMNRQVLLDGRPADVRDLLKDPVLFRVLSNEDLPFEIPFYCVENNPD